MFINIRYLIVTLAAVFIALGIGILIGFQLDTNTIILQQQTELIDSLEVTFSDLAEANKTLKAQVNDLQGHLDQNMIYAKQLSSQYLKYKLEGLNVAVIYIGSDTKDIPVKQVLSLAGANVGPSCVITDAALAEAEAKSPLITKPQLCQAIVTYIVQGKDSDVKRLVELGFIELEANYLQPLDFIIVATGNSPLPNIGDPIDVFLIKELTDTGISIVAVESSNFASSNMPYYQKNGISTVDNVDTIIGQTSLVLVIDGLEGNFGIKAAASALLPCTDQEDPW